MSRRLFLEAGIALGGALVIGTSTAGCGGPAGNAPAHGAARSVNAWLELRADGRLVVIVDRGEMGQGVATALAALVAEELDVDLDSVEVVFGSGRPEYVNRLFGMQVTAASSSVALGWLPLRHAGATARAMFIEAAARLWGLAPADCVTAHGSVVAGQRRIAYGALGPHLRGPPRQAVRLKRAADFRLLGRPLGALDAPSLTTGTARYGIDVRVPGLRRAVVQHAPRPGGRVRSFDAAAARAVAGVAAVVELPAGVAVVGDTTWCVLQARERLRVEWTLPAATADSPALEAGFVAALEQRGRSVRRDGDDRQAFAVAADTAAADYTVPYQAHAPLEPMNCTADVRAGRCTVWVGTQNPDGARLAAADASGLALEAVQVHVLRMGGSFGRRQEVDFIAEAVALSRAVGGPVQLLWTRADEFAGDYFRPAAACRVAAALGPSGEWLGWRHQIASTAIWKRIVGEYAGLKHLRWMPAAARRVVTHLVRRAAEFGPDPNLAEGAVGFPYDVPNVSVEYREHDPGVPAGAWRSVGHSYNVFAIECFVDELAARLGRDPAEFRRAALAHQPRLLAVLDRALQLASAAAPAAHRYRGLAVHDYRGTSVATVAEIAADPGTRPRVTRIVCAVDCGFVVNPLGAAAQVEGAVAFGLGATLSHSISFRDGAVAESNFDRFRLLTMAQMPPVEVAFVASDLPPSGIGEAAVPGVAPAVCNALAAATGRRFRSLPVRLEAVRGGAGSAVSA